MYIKQYNCYVGDIFMGKVHLYVIYDVCGCVHTNM
jgi:hypothetical protein